MATTTQETFFICDSYKEAQESTAGYEDDNLIKDLVLKIKKNPPWKLKSSLFIANRQLELLAAIMRIICENKYSHIKVADVGGNGYLSIVIKNTLPMFSWEWIVFESDKVVKNYRQFESESNIKWEYSKNILADNYNISLFSCTLQYLKNPFKSLKKFAFKSDYLIIMRIPFVDNESHIITKQTFPNNGDYQTTNSSWPAWFFQEINL
jgi:putative methyltransferase (TIGR04325 family)